MAPCVPAPNQSPNIQSPTLSTVSMIVSMIPPNGISSPYCRASIALSLWLVDSNQPPGVPRFEWGSVRGGHAQRLVIRFLTYSTPAVKGSVLHRSIAAMLPQPLLELVHFQWPQAAPPGRPAHEPFVVFRAHLPKHSAVDPATRPLLHTVRTIVCLPRRRMQVANIAAECGQHPSLSLQAGPRW